MAKPLRKKSIERTLKFEELLKFNSKLLTQKQKLFLLEVADLHDLKVTPSSIESIEQFEQFLRCFAFHKDSKTRKETGLQRVALLRKVYWTEPEDLNYLALKLNQSIREDEYHLTAQDVAFMIDCLNKSHRPLKFEAFSDIDPEDEQLADEEKQMH